MAEQTQNTVVETNPLVEMATVVISWASFSNEDIEPGAGPDEGWYVTVEVGEESLEIGPDFFGPGFKTFDEALAKVKKWADGRGLRVSTTAFWLPVLGPGAESGGS